MSETQKPYHSDEATAVDGLKREQYAQALARLAETCDTPLVVGLFGTWGIGKSSLMLQIEDKLDKRKTLAIRFDPWMHQFEENPVLALAHTVVGKLSSSALEEGKKLLTVITAALGSSFLKKTTGLSASDVEKLGKKYEEERFQIRDARVRLREYFEKIVSKLRKNKRLVFFIDDLDRCMSEEVLKLLEALKLYLNLEECVYFLGVDPEALDRSIRKRYEDISGIDYLAKIVQLDFQIPPIEPGAMVKFIDGLLPEDLKNAGEMLVAGKGDNPREVKRLVNALRLNFELAKTSGIEKPDPKMITALLLLQREAPNLFRRLPIEPELFQRLVDESKSRNG